MSRIDYVRLALPFEAELSAKFVMRWEELAESIRAEMAQGKKPYDKTSKFDHQRHRWIAYFNVWGPVADAFFYSLEAGDLRYISRLDKRYKIAEAGLDFGALFNQAEAIAGERNTVQYFKSAARARRDGRGAGGSGIVIGGDGAARRVTVYKRHNEGPAVEFQFNSLPCRKMVEKVLQNGAGQNRTIHEEIDFQLSVIAQDQFRRRLGCTLETLEGGGAVQMQVSDYTNTEQLMTQASLFFDALPLDKRHELLCEFEAKVEDEVRAAAGELELTNPDDWDDDDEDNDEDEDTKGLDEYERISTSTPNDDEEEDLGERTTFRERWLRGELPEEYY